MTDYSDALAYLYNLEKFGIVFGLENIRWILDCIGNPQGVLKTIHVGGTNGKGSVSAMLSHIARAAGYRVGKYTSPHLVSFTERITVNEEEITEAEVVGLTSHIRYHVENADPAKTFTFFDFTTALAFEHFRRKHVDMALIEVGLGGRLDSTNVLNPLISIITNVALDHIEYLGDDILDIAKEKAGIIKRGIPVVTGAKKGPLRIIEEAGKASGSPVYVMGKDFSYEKKGTQNMSYTGLTKRFDDMYVNLRGDHQLENAAISVCAGELLSTYGYKIDEKDIRSGLSQVIWPGRLEVVREHPTIILDGAHNVEGVRALADFLESQLSGRRKVLIFGVMKDKEYEKMLSELNHSVDKTIFTTVSSERALVPEVLKKYVPQAIVAHDISSALNMAKSMTGEKDVIVVTGSLYLIGECKTVINDIF